jgi:hypothetical protein
MDEPDNTERVLIVVERSLAGRDDEPTLKHDFELDDEEEACEPTSI